MVEEVGPGPKNRSSFLSLTVVQRRRMRLDRGRTVLALLGSVVGGALFVAVVAVHLSIGSSIDDLVAIGRHADLEVASLGPDGYDEALYPAVASVPGIEVAAPVLRSEVLVGGRRVLLLGLDLRALAFAGDDADEARDLLESTSDLNGVFVTGALADELDDDATHVDLIGPSGRTARPRLLGTLDATALDVGGGAIAVAALPIAQGLSERVGRIDSILISLAEGADRDAVARAVADAVGRTAVVASPQLRADHAEDAANPIRQGLYLVAGAALILAGFIVFNVASMGTLEQRRDLATLRALGARRRELLGAVVACSAVLAALGALVGCAAGVLLARALVANLPPFISSAIGADVRFSLDPAVLPIGIAATVAVSVAATLVASRRALAAPPVESMRPLGAHEEPLAAASRRWPSVGIGVALLLVALEAPSLGRGAGALVLAVVGALLVVRGLLGPLLHLAATGASLGSTSAQLAAVSLKRSPGRAWTTVSAVLVCAATLVAVQGTRSDLERTVGSRLEGLPSDRLFVETNRRGELPVNTLLSPTIASALAEVPGVVATTSALFLLTDVGGERVVVQGVSGPSSINLFRSAPSAAQQAVLAGDGAIVSSKLARARDLSVGSPLELATPSGPVRLPVVDIQDSLLGMGGVVVLGFDRVQEWFGVDNASWIELRLDADADPAATRAAIEQVVSGEPYPVFVRSAAEAATDASDAMAGLLSVFSALEWLVLLAAALAVFNTLTISVKERTRDLGVLRAVGASRARVARSIVVEAGALAVLGGLCALLTGAVLHVIAVRAVSRSTGIPITAETAVAPLLVVLLLACAVSVAAAVAPARRASRLDVLTAVGYE